jgi:hypothetical protein
MLLEVVSLSFICGRLNSSHITLCELLKANLQKQLTKMVVLSLKACLPSRSKNRDRPFWLYLKELYNYQSTSKLTKVVALLLSE